MAHYTDFKLYWEEWGGYPDREHAFGNPRLFWIIAQGESAAACNVFRTSTGSMTSADHAEWARIPYELFTPLPALLEEINVFDNPQTLVLSNPAGDYRCVWDFTGVVGDRPFHFAINFCSGPVSEEWTPLGRQFRENLFALRNAAGEQK
jgi:hypothetical protein